MKVAIDNTKYIKKIKDNEIFYIFDDDANLEDLINTGLHCIHKDYIKYVDINLSKYDIPCRKKTNIRDRKWNILPPKKNYKFAIIVPNYNYEEWIKKCLKSILNQTYKNFEIIFVDDVSTDNSVKIAKKLLKPPHKVIELKQKRLNGGARNEAYLHISKDVDYIWYVDSDDWIKEEALDVINDSLQTNPDVVFIGISYYKNGQETIYDIPEYKNRYEAIQGWSGSCGKVIKKELATRQECLYNEGTLKEDRNQHRKICIYMKSFVNLNKSVYVWNQTNTKSVTTVREKVVWGTSTIRHYADTLQLYLSVKGQDKRIDDILLDAVKQTKYEIDQGGDQQW